MPAWKEEIRRRLESLKLDPIRELEIVEELAQHLEERYEELRAGGATEAEAVRSALLELSVGKLLAQELRRVELHAGYEPVVLGASRRNIMGDLWQDFSYGLRMLRKCPSFTAIAVLTLGLAIGANTAIFSVVNAVLLNPLPFSEPDRLVKFWLSAPEKGLPVVELTQGLFVYFRDRNRTFEKMAAYGSAGFNLTGAGEAERLNGTNVTFDFFSILGQQPLYGRTFLPHEDTPGNNLVTVLSYAVWQRRFGGDPGIVGRSLNLNNIPTVVVGIMPPEFDFPNRTELWIPLGLNPQVMNCFCYPGIGRLKPGLTPADAQREIAALSDDFWRERDPNAKGGSIAVAETLLRTMVGEVRAPLVVLLCAVGLVLLIACANIANLLLARANSRSREIAVRCCLGASALRIVRQFLVESLLLALAGAGAGLLLAFWGLKGLKRLALADVPRIEQVRLDPTVLIFTLAVALLTGFLLGLAPALRGARVNLQGYLKEGVRSTHSLLTRRWNHAFVITQFALSLVLLIGAALLLQSFQRLLSVNPGFRPENILTARLSLPPRKYTDQSQVRNFYQQLLERVGSMPGVRGAGLSQNVPFNPGNWQDEFIVQGQEPGPGEPIPVVSVRSATPGYFETMGIPLLSGRPFQDTDNESAPLVAIVDEKLARKYWPDGNAIGRRIRRGNLSSSSDTPWLTIVGVVASVKHTRLEEDSSFYLYRPHAQNVPWMAYLVVRTSDDPQALTSAVRSQLSALDPEVPLFAVDTMEAAVARSLNTRRLTNMLLAGLAATAALLAVLGIYGVMSLSVSSRTGEFGIRMALGARQSNVLQLVVKQGMRLAIIGVTIGLAVAYGLTGLMKSLLFGVSPTDPATFAVIALLFAGVALLACFIPARRATTVDPMVALRCE
jgi:putative ABC transport system permease protein